MGKKKALTGIGSALAVLGMPIGGAIAAGIGQATKKKENVTSAAPTAEEIDKTASGGENPFGEGALSGMSANTKKKKQASIAGIGEGAGVLG